MMRLVIIFDPLSTKDLTLIHFSKIQIQTQSLRISFEKKYILTSGSKIIPFMIGQP